MHRRSLPLIILVHGVQDLTLHSNIFKLIISWIRSFHKPHKLKLLNVIKDLINLTYIEDN